DACNKHIGTGRRLRNGKQMGKGVGVHPLMNIHHRVAEFRDGGVGPADGNQGNATEGQKQLKQHRHGWCPWRRAMMKLARMASGIMTPTTCNSENLSSTTSAIVTMPATI